MKLLRPFAILLCALLALPLDARNPHGFAAGFTTNFPATENPISQGGIWTNGTITGTNTAVQTTSGLAFATQVAHMAPPFDDSIAVLSGYNPGQWVQATAFNSSATCREIELLLHITLAANFASGYEMDFTTNFGLNIVRWNGTIGSFTFIAMGISDSACTANGAVDRAQDVAGVITVTCGGTQVYQGTDTTYLTGNPGMGFYADTSSGCSPTANNTIGWSSLQAANL